MKEMKEYFQASIVKNYKYRHVQSNWFKLQVLPSKISYQTHMLN